MVTTDDERRDLEQRVHVDLPRIPVEEMTTAHETDPPPDPTGGRDVEAEFLIRHAGW